MKHGKDDKAFRNIIVSWSNKIDRFVKTRKQGRQESQISENFIIEVSSEDIFKLVKYDIIELEVEKFMEEFYTNLLQIKNKAIKWNSCLANALANNQDTFANGIKAAVFFRKGYTFDNRGIFIFMNFLTRTIENM